MCRFVVYRGESLCLADLVTRPNHSLITQSFNALERPEPLNGDGFGIGWYNTGDPLPGLFTSLTPAWGNRNLYRLAEKLHSSCIFAHLRAASPGLIVSEVNCHPFIKDHCLWMHNGRIPDFHKIKRKLRHVLKDEFYDMIQGTTDSEHAFALFLNYLSEFDDPGVEDYRSCLRATIHQLNTWTEEAGIEEPSAFNFAFTDGSQVVVTRYSSNPDIAAPESLYTAQICHYHCDQQDGNVHLDHGPTEAVIIASEPLTPLKHEWQAVETNSLLTISADVRLESEPL